MYRCQEPKSIWITFSFFQLCHASLLFSFSFQVFSTFFRFPSPTTTTTTSHPSFFLLILSTPPAAFLWNFLRFASDLSESQMRIKGKISGSVTLRVGAVWVHIVIWSWAGVWVTTWHTILRASWFQFSLF